MIIATALLCGAFESKRPSARRGTCDSSEDSLEAASHDFDSSASRLARSWSLGSLGCLISLLMTDAGPRPSSTLLLQTACWPLSIRTLLTLCLQRVLMQHSNVLPESVVCVRRAVHSRTSSIWFLLLWVAAKVVSSSSRLALAPERRLL